MLALPAPLLRARDAALPLVERLSFLPPLVARVTVGLVFAQSGWGKLHNLERVAKFFTSLGIPAPGLNAAFVGTVEFAGGLLLVAGLLTRLVSLPLIGTMAVALITAKREEITSLNSLFGQQEWLFIVLLGWLAIAGAGKASLDRLFFRNDRA